MIPVVERVVIEVPIELIDPPDIPMRGSLDDAAWNDLKDSVQLNGIQVALIVERRGDRFKISAGHRRYLVGKELGALTLPCDIRDASDLDAEAIKVIENDDREKVNPADAANYLARLFVERCHSDVDQVCALLRKSRKYVEDRLSLLQGDAEVLDAVRSRRIGLGVALELNKIGHIGYRRMWLDRALADGLTEEAARRARRECNRATELPPGQVDAAAPLPEPPPAEARNHCVCCLKHDNPQNLRWIIVHDYCQLAVLDTVMSNWRASMNFGPAAASSDQA